jgi:osmoprotectant transport system permease protein
MKKLLQVSLLSILISSLGAQCQDKEFAIGSKKFTESYVLGEIAKEKLKRAGYKVTHKQGMGGTLILWEALKAGSVIAYPEYTGTLQEAIFGQPLSSAQLKKALAEQGLGMTDNLGFNNTYALVMPKDKAQRLHIAKISDLGKHPSLRVGLSHEFWKRKDGWEPLTRSYNLQMNDVRGLDHTLGYISLAAGNIDLMDAYSTDAKLESQNLLVLQDDLKFFPDYAAIYLYRLDAPKTLVAALNETAGTIGQSKMIGLNAKAERDKSYQKAAATYFNIGSEGLKSQNDSRQMLGWICQHLTLVSLSLLFAIIAGIPLGIWASNGGPAGQIILGISSIIQTIPSLALLALLVPIPFLGISSQTAILALFLYSLLPIVRNTASGLQNIPQPLRESALALGLEPSAQMLQIFIPLASRQILTGVKTSAIINIGTATLAALIGAGGLGEPIVSGLNLNDHKTILMGAIPAALLALVVQFLFELADQKVIPKGLRLQAKRLD